MQKEINVEILESEKISPIITWGKNLKSSSVKIKDDYDIAFAMCAKYQHLYFTTDDEIKAGDWVIYNPTDNKKNGRIFKCLKIRENFCGIINDNVESNIVIDFCKKIIASTDTSLKLPYPYKDWVIYYIYQWNHGNVIEKVTVEYENAFDETYGEVNGFFLKINKDNTININKPEKIWTRKEVVNLVNEAYLNGIKDIGLDKHNKWIEENI